MSKYIIRLKSSENLNEVKKYAEVIFTSEILRNVFGIKINTKQEYYKLKELECIETIVKARKGDFDKN